MRSLLVLVVVGLGMAGTDAASAQGLPSAGWAVIPEAPPSPDVVCVFLLDCSCFDPPSPLPWTCLPGLPDDFGIDVRYLVQWVEQVLGGLAPWTSGLLDNLCRDHVPDAAC